MQNKFKWVTLGTVLSLILSLTITPVAAGVSQKINVILNEFSVKYNDKVIKTNTITYNGKYYAEVKDIASAFGKTATIEKGFLSIKDKPIATPTPILTPTPVAAPVSDSVSNANAGLWTTMKNKIEKSKSEGLALISKDQTSIHMLSSNDMGKVVTVGNKIYMIGDEGIVEEYDPLTDTWKDKYEISSLKDTKRFFKLVTINNKIYIVGANFSDILEYDPAANECKFKAKLPSERVVGAVASLNNKIYLFGGRNYKDSSLNILSFSLNIFVFHSISF